MKNLQKSIIQKNQKIKNSQISKKNFNEIFLKLQISKSPKFTKIKNLKKIHN